MVARQYYYGLKQTIWQNEKRWNLYVTANRRFSLKELLAKQHFVLSHIDELPFNNITLKLAASRESFQVIEPIFPEPETAAFHLDEVTLDKISRKVMWDYDFVLEFVFDNEQHIDPFLNFLQKHWKGKWNKAEE